ncbi:hypothetical protein [Echinicola jeungdonensis]|uniref:hypothetical protein n=1 Tax=Echinicola jeungdonensis TaxID=709343 RepID=UPI0036D31974
MRNVRDVSGYWHYISIIAETITFPILSFNFTRAEPPLGGAVLLIPMRVPVKVKEKEAPFSSVRLSVNSSSMTWCSQSPK